MSTTSLRSQVIQLYKQLYYMGKEYPGGAEFFHTKLKKAFLKNKDVTDPGQIAMLVGRGDFIIKEIEALYMLRKYRSLKKSYYEEPETAVKKQMDKINQETKQFTS